MHDPLLNEKIYKLIQRGVFINVIAGVFDEPQVIRALGCRIPSDMSKLAVFVSADCPASYLSRLHKESAIAVEFSLPVLDHVVEIKGRDVRFGALRSDDLELIERYQKTLVTEVVAMGKRESLAMSIVPKQLSDIVAVNFTPTSTFIRRHGHRALFASRDHRRHDLPK